MPRLVPVSLKEANAFVQAYHRHHRAVVGHKFSIGCEAGGHLVGVAIVGRPVSRHLDNGLTLEVTRLCTTGEKNACSMLYAAAARAARAMGYQKIITYTLDTEHGSSIRAAGWRCAGPAGGLRWTGARCPTTDLYPPQMKQRYEKMLQGGDLIGPGSAYGPALRQDVRRAGQVPWMAVGAAAGGDFEPRL